MEIFNDATPTAQCIIYLPKQKVGRVIVICLSEDMKKNCVCTIFVAGGGK